MTIANCPKCRDHVTLPVGASAQANVQCPLCQETFVLAEALDQLPPTLVVLSDPEPALSARTGDDRYSPAMFELAAGDAGTSSDRGGTAVATEAGFVQPAFNFEAGSATTANHKPRATRPRKPRRSVAREIIQVAVGGVVGLSLAQLILWWLPGQWKRDPFDLGPKVSRVAAFIVPAKFHDPALASPNAEPPVNQDSVANEMPSRFGFPDPPQVQESQSVGNKKQRKRRPTGAARVARQQGVDDETLEDEPEPSVAALEDSPLDRQILERPAEIEVPQIDLAPLPGVSGEGTEGDVNVDAESAFKDLESLPSTSSDPSTGASSASPGSNDPVLTAINVRNAPEFSSTKLAERFSRALRANSMLDTSENPSPTERRRLVTDFYVSLAELGEALAFVDQQESKTSEQLGDIAELVREIGNQSDKLTLIERVTPSWLANHRNNGVIVLGKIKTVDPMGPYYGTELVLQNNESLVIVSATDPTAHYRPGASVLVLGTILEAPRDNLGDFCGEVPFVVLEGLHVGL